jgi:putative transposase
VRALQEYGLSQVRACAIIGQPRRTLHYCTKPKNDSEIAERIQVLAQQRPRWGWRRLLIMIRRDKVDVGEFRFRGIYRSLALQVRPRKKRKVRYIRGNVIPAVSRPNERWSIDFVHALSQWSKCSSDRRCRRFQSRMPRPGGRLLVWKPRRHPLLRRSRL